MLSATVLGSVITHLMDKRQIIPTLLIDGDFSIPFLVLLGT